MNRGVGLLSMVLVIASVLCTTGCQSCDPLDGARPGRAATKQFFKDWNNSDWNAIAANLDPELLKLTPADEVKGQLRSIYATLGNEISTSEKRGESHVFGSTVGYWTDWDTKFERGTGVVNLQWKIENGKARIDGWHITSSALPEQ